MVSSSSGILWNAPGSSGSHSPISWATEVGVVVTGDAAATTGTTPGTPGTVGTAPRQGEKASWVGKEGGLMASKQIGDLFSISIGYKLEIVRTY